MEGLNFRLSNNKHLIKPIQGHDISSQMFTEVQTPSQMSHYHHIFNCLKI